MAIEIDELVKVVSLDRVTEVLLNAFVNYPKLMHAFPDNYGRRNALELSLRYFGQYDMYYGKAYTLDEDVFEVALLRESKDMKPSKRKCLKAGCYSIEYQEIKERMPALERKKRLKLVNEFIDLEKTIPFPKNHLYISYLGVAKDKQGEGRGSQLIEKICDYADSQELPLTLYTSSEKQQGFFENFGFSELKTVSSEKFGFTNIYMIRNPQSN